MKTPKMDYLRLRNCIAKAKDISEIKPTSNDFLVYFWPQEYQLKRIYSIAVIVNQTLHVFHNYEYCYSILSPSAQFVDRYHQHNMPYLDEYRAHPYLWDNAMREDYSNKISVQKRVMSDNKSKYKQGRDKYNT